MTSKIFNLGIIRESRVDETRTPLAPKNIKELKKKFPNVHITIQPSNKRCFNDAEYLKVGVRINEDLNSSDLILGVKEINTNILINNKKYLFFSHTSKIQANNSETAQGTPGMDKKELLETVLNKKITLIDYENIRDKNNMRYLGFGRFAGIVGCYNSLALFENSSSNVKLPRAYEINNYSLLKVKVQEKKFYKNKLLITGDGRVANGVLELLKHTNFKQVTKKEFIKEKFEIPVFCNLQTSDYVNFSSNNKFDLKHFIQNPEKYISIAEKYLEQANLLISAHYWDPLSPKIFELKNLYKFNKLKVIGDITCDINGSIPTTFRSTSIKDPYFYVDKNSNSEVQKSLNAIAVMAVDNLPSELPRDSSEEFGEAIVKEVLPFIINSDDNRILNATIIKNGNFLKKYLYLKQYISS